MAQVRAGSTTLRRPDPDNPEEVLEFGVVALEVRTDTSEHTFILERPEFRDTLITDLLATLSDEEREELRKALVGGQLIVADASDMPNGAPGQ